MTLQAYEMNTQYQKTQMSYELSITPVDQERLEKQKEIEELDGVDNHVTNLPVVFANESDLSSFDKIKKMLMQQVLGTFESGQPPVGLFPNGDISMDRDFESRGNPYAQNGNALPQGFMYQSSSEYYEKTTIDFSAEAIIKTPNGEYKIELNFSYTHEFYEKNETQIQISHGNMRNPLEINLDEDDESLKDLKSLHFIFDLIKKQDKEEEKDMFEQIREALRQRREMMLELLHGSDKEDKPEIAQELRPAPIDNFQLWHASNESEFNLVAAQKDGVGVFFANTSQDSSYFKFSANPNGFSFESGYSSSETSISYAEIKA